MYDAFILDQWGVMHDGVNGLYKAAAVVAELARLGKRLVILSNSSRRAEATLDALERFGYDRAVFTGAVTSGEQANKALREIVAQKDEPTKCLWFCYPPEASGLGSFEEGLEKLLAVDDIDEAEFILAQGCEMIKSQDGNHTALPDAVRKSGDLSAVEHLLRRGVERGIPMQCVNPDCTVVQQGETCHVTGVLAKRYKELGGSVIYHGKPFREHFEAAISIVMAGSDGQVSLSRDRICHVGDSLHHDICGANGAGIASVWVAGGSSIHANAMGLEGEFAQQPRGDSLSMEEVAIEVIAANGGFKPTHIIHSLSQI